MSGKPEISLNAITGTPIAKTIRLIGRVGKEQVVILVDSESTHNFLNLSIAKKSKLLVDKSQRVAVKIANG